MRSVYSFQVLDPDPESLTFGCIADSESDARRQGLLAGYSGLVLTEVRPLGGHELDEVNELEVLANPFLGPEWAPLVEAIAHGIDRGGPGRRWELSVAVAPYDWGYRRGVPGQTDFIQAIDEADGSLHLEIGTYDVTVEQRKAALDFLSFSGWEPPANDLPLHYRSFDPGWNAWHVLHVACQAMVVVFGATARDIFIPKGIALDALRSSSHFDEGRWIGPLRIESPAFALRGEHPLSKEEPPQHVKDELMSRYFS